MSPVLDIIDDLKWEKEREKLDQNKTSTKKKDECELKRKCSSFMSFPR